jgi:hypothetical protein
MKRIATWVFYAIGTLAILYIVLYAYAAYTGRALAPGDPIHIFRKPGGGHLAFAAGLPQVSNAKRGQADAMGR